MSRQPSALQGLVGIYADYPAQIGPIGALPQHSGAADGCDGETGQPDRDVLLSQWQCLT